MSIPCLGTLNISVLITSRLTAAAAFRGYLPNFRIDTVHPAPSWLSEQHAHQSSKENRRFLRQHRSGIKDPRRLQRKKTCELLLLYPNTPYIRKTIVFNACMKCGYIMVGTFGPLITFPGKIKDRSFAASILDKLREPFKPRAGTIHVQLP